MKIAFMGLTKPQAGVMATNPATAPVAAPRTVGAPWCHHSMRAQVNPAAAVAIWVVTKALAAARWLPGRCGVEAEPPKPEKRRPQDREGQIMRPERLLGITATFSRRTAKVSAETPELTWTTIRQRSPGPPGSGAKPHPPDQ
jgi:hypothetical protein